ncbi:hypothetical protein [Streptomyces sp. NBC_01353]|uniref:hypothetical protein n=1 Tax=Streptomyces sp. NBC_01353 TaxID=2903835 RepID=UPI002E36C939|nr:hypothetical protein [Streptomyces sp. NBC_01353]
MPDDSEGRPADREGAPTVKEGGASLWLWSLLGAFTVAAPSALLVVEKTGSGLRPAPVILMLLAALAGLVLAVRVLVRERFARRSRRVRVLFCVASGALFFFSVALLFVFREPSDPLVRIGGVRDVAVVGFAAPGGHQDRRVLADVSAELARTMAERIPAATAARSYATEAALPLDDLQGAERRRLDGRTESFADETNAEIVVGGLVTSDTAGQTTVRPAVYVRADQVPDSPELAGWYLSEPILMARGWDSARGRARLGAELTERTSSLAQFIDALDAWRNGSPAEARRILTGLLDTARLDGSSFVPPDLVRLFRGQAMEREAAGFFGPTRMELLDMARQDFLAIPENSAIARRAALSLAANSYRRALGPTPSCEPGRVQGEELAAVSRALRSMSGNREFTELMRLKATANLAQVEHCRVRAGLIADDGTVERLVAAVREAPAITGSAELRALAESIAAVAAEYRGDRAAARKNIRAAIDQSQSFVERGIWYGLLASWSLADCDVEAGRRAQQESLTQLTAAMENGQLSAELRGEYQRIYAAEWGEAQERCGESR